MSAAWASILWKVIIGKCGTKWAPLQGWKIWLILESLASKRSTPELRRHNKDEWMHMIYCTTPVFDQIKTAWLTASGFASTIYRKFCSFPHELTQVMKTVQRTSNPSMIRPFVFPKQGVECDNTMTTATDRSPSLCHFSIFKKASEVWCAIRQTKFGVSFASIKGKFHRKFCF